MFVFFFFSSRRRHTRWNCDWSSDVCSSDLDAPRSLEPFGLDKPVRLEIQTGRDKDRATKTLLVGRVDPAKKGVYAMRPGESSVMLIPDETWTAVPKNVAVLRDKSIVGFDRDKVTKIEIEGPKGTVTLAPDQVEAGAVLFKLRDLRAQAFLTDDASGIPRYLGKPTVRVNITEQGASDPRTVLLAPSTEKRGGGASAYAAVAGRGPVALVDGRALDELGRSLDDLRDRTLLLGKREGDQAWVKVKAAPAIYAVDAKQLGETPKVPDDFKG